MNDFQVGIGSTGEWYPNEILLQETKPLVTEKCSFEY